MGEKIIVGPITRGLRNDVKPFNVDNDSFPVLRNLYQWRGRIRRKRGTELLGRLQRYFDSLSTVYNPGTTTQVLDGAGNGNLLTGFTSSGLQANGTIVPGTLIVTGAFGIYSDVAGNGSLSPSGSINYGTGALTIAAEAGQTFNARFQYYPSLPVMGLEDLHLTSTSNTEVLAFDTRYSYFISNAFPYTIHAVNFYNNPATGDYAGYTQKSLWTSLVWNAEDYRQFWTVNYQGALWACNGTSRPFLTTNIGMQYKAITTVTVLSPTTATLAIASHGLVIGDFVFINEVTTTTGINFQTGYVTAVPTAGSVTVTFPNATLANNGTGGIAQYLTNNSDPTRDCIRFYNGNPCDSSAPPVFAERFGWVNFCPPLSNLDFQVADLPPDQYYLVGARMIVPFKDRLLFIGPVVQTSTAGSQRYLNDTVIFSQNGTPYYTASFAGEPSATKTYNALLVPVNQTASPQTFWADQTGLGGWISAGFSSDINTVSQNEDVLVLGFGDRQARFVYTSNDLLPFEFYVINSELGSGSTFSAVNLDRGVISVGTRGIIITSQIESKRLDLDIPDQVFQFEISDNGSERICAQRDFINEWIYFTYNPNESSNVYPTQTLQYNYRDGSWALFDETFTTYGLFRRRTGYTWVGVRTIYKTWSAWTDPWDAGASTLLQPEVIGGNAQGFVLFKDKGTGEAPSGYIRTISPTGTINSPNHSLENGQYIYIEGCLGAVGAQINNKVFKIFGVTQNTFNISYTETLGAYIGEGQFRWLTVPFLQTRQFPVSWEMARKTRLGPQQYLFTNTPNAAVTVLIYLSQNADDAYNNGPVIPSPNVENNALIYSSTLSTGPELYEQTSSNLSLGNIGDGVATSYFFNLKTLFGFQLGLVIGSLRVSVGSVATFTDNGSGGWTVTGTGSGGSIDYALGTMTLTFSSAPTSEAGLLDMAYYYPDIMNPIASQQQQIWHRMNTSLIGDTIQIGITLSDEQMRQDSLLNATAALELHAFVLDVSPSGYLA